METTPRRPSEAARETVGMRRWLRLTARKTVVTKTTAAASGNAAANAAADALASLMRDAKKLA